MKKYERLRIFPFELKNMSLIQSEIKTTTTNAMKILALKFI